MMVIVVLMVVVIVALWLHIISINGTLMMVNFLALVFFALF